MPRKLWRCGSNGSLELSETEIRTLKPGFVRIVPHAVGFNPTDYKHLVNKLAVGAGAGCDFAGVIREVGPEVSGFAVGDTVAGGQTGSNIKIPEDGVYSELIDVRADSLFKFPVKLVEDPRDEIPSGPVQSFEQAASLGVALGTVAIAFCWHNQTPLKQNSKSGFALVYGAAGSLGWAASQILRYMGYDVIAVASKKHRKLFDSIGVKHLVDYHDDDWVKQVRAIGGDDIVYAYDTICLGKSFAQVYDAVSSTKPVKINCSLPVNKKKLPELNKPKVSYDAPLWYHLWNETWPMGWFKNQAPAEQLAMTPEMFKQLNAILAQGWFRALPIKVAGTGFESIPKAMELFGKGVSGEKMVVRLRNTSKL